MILDSIQNTEKYKTINARFEAAMDFLLVHKDGGLAAGRYEIADGVYAMAQYYNSKPISEGKYEAHKKFIDIQYIVNGEELIGWQTLNKMSLIEFFEEKDFLHMQGKGDMVPLTAGNFMILYPEDAHMPGIEMNGSVPVEKIVVKVAVG